MQRDTRTQLLAAAVMVLCLAVSGVLAVRLTASSGRNRLVYTDKAVEADPPQVATGIAMGAFRGLFVNMLWIRANALKEDGRYYEAMDLAKAITKLQPRFPQVWIFHAWNMAYNISVTTMTPEERWQWVNAGINLLRDQGIPANPNDMLLHKELAWIFLHKVGGYMDDANVYYKRRLAAEWTEVLGPPPQPDPLDRDRKHATQKYVEWLRPIAESPENPQDVVKRESLTTELVKTLRERTKNQMQPGEDLVRAYAHAEAISKSGARSWYEARMNPDDKAFIDMVADPQWKKAWDVLIPYLRRRVLVDHYHMDPDLMVRFTEKFGPLDWRHYGAHAVYWGQRGYERAQERVNNQNKRDFDFVNSGRIVVQALQEMWRSGDLTFDFLAYIRDPNNNHVFWRGSPNIHFMDAYGELLDDYVEKSWADKASRVYSLYAAGYENFRKDAIRFLYRRGEKQLASKMKDDLAVWKHHNIHDNERKELFALNLDDFVKKELTDQALTRPSVAREEVVGALQGAYIQGLIAGDMELYREQFDYARLTHEYFFIKQGWKNQLDPNQLRMAQMDSDFVMVAGTEFAALANTLDVENAERLFDKAPDQIKRFGYDLLADHFRDVLDTTAKEGKGRTFAQVFPEPPDMARFREQIEAKAKERGNVPGVELK